MNKLNLKNKNFSLNSNIYVEEINSSLIEVTHIPTQAKIIHIANDDLENFFSLSFKTSPSSSNGVAHVLEHTVLCGSKKFPIKDPFFSMTRRSLNTYMNALTGADFTCYPASSENEKDFYNLLDVYVDSVFHPNLNYLSFLQEGIRLEFSNPSDSSSPLQYKGIVYNEMKGSLNSSEDRLWHKMMEELLSDLPYSYNSGGDPKEIPNLTYQDLLDFHKTYYHPSQCLFFFYGNIPLEKHLAFLEEKVFNKVEKKVIAVPTKKQRRFSAPKEIKAFYPTAEEDKNNKDIVAFGFLTCQISDQKEVLALSLIDSILTENDASVLTLPLLQSGLCNQVETVFESEMSEIPWLIIFRGTEEKHKNALFEIFEKTLKKIIKEKFSNDQIEAAMHQLEFSRTEIDRSSAPYGLTLFMRTALLKQHGCAIENGLKIHSLFAELKKDLSDPNYLTDLIEKYFLSNTNLVKLSLLPDPNLEQKENTFEKEKLKKIKEKLNGAEIEKILKETKELKTFQEKQEGISLNCLPKIDIKDIPQDLKYYPLTSEKNGNFEVFFHQCFTNKIVYVDLVFDLPDLSIEELPLLSLFTSMLTEIGCGKRSYIENLEYINSFIGDINAYLSLNIQATDSNICRPTVSIRGKALYRNAEKLFSLIKDIFSTPNFKDKNRIKELLLQTYTSLSSSINQSAMSYAVSQSLKTLSVPNLMNNQLNGLPLFEKVKEIALNIEKEINPFIEKLNDFQQKILSFSKAEIIISCDKEFFDMLQKNSYYSLTSLKAHTPTVFTNSFTLPASSKNEGKIIASPVAFTAMAFKTIGFDHKDAPYLLLATSISENKILHPLIREQGGAYGSGTTYNPNSGSLYFYAFRDPHIASSLDAFYLAIEELSKGNFEEENLFEAKLQAIQNIDAPTSPGKKALITFYNEKSGKTRKMREEFRKKILLAEKSQVQKAVLNHILIQKEKAKIVSFASIELLEKENIKLPQPLFVQPI